MVDEASEEQEDLAVCCEHHEDYFVPEGMLKEIRLNHIHRFSDEAQTVEDGEANHAFDVASYSWENVRMGPHLCNVAAIIDEIIEDAVLNRLSNE